LKELNTLINTKLTEVGYFISKLPKGQKAAPIAWRSLYGEGYEAAQASKSEYRYNMKNSDSIRAKIGAFSTATMEKEFNRLMITYVGGRIPTLEPKIKSAFTGIKSNSERVELVLGKMLYDILLKKSPDLEICLEPQPVLDNYYHESVWNFWKKLGFTPYIAHISQTPYFQTSDETLVTIPDVILDAGIERRGVLFRAPASHVNKCLLAELKKK